MWWQTSGLCAFKYRGIYFVSADSQIDGSSFELGYKHLKQVPESKESLEVWIEKQRAFYDQEIRYLSEMGEDVDFGYFYRPSANRPEDVYTIDLDRKTFSIDDSVHFRLDTIPRGWNDGAWTDYMTLDGLGTRCLMPSTPQEYTADLHPLIIVPRRGMTTYRALRPRPRLIRPEEWMFPSSWDAASRILTTTVAKSILHLLYGELASVHQYQPNDPRFQRAAEFLLRACAPGFLGFSTDGPDQRVGQAEEGINEKFTGRRSGLYYWFRGCLIVLSSKLDSEKHLHANVGLVVARMRRRGIKRCTALLWSVRHVAVVTMSETTRLSGNGRYHNTVTQVAHSAAMPVLAAYGVDDSALAKSLHLLAHCLRPYQLRDEKGLPVIYGTGIHSGSTIGRCEEVSGRDRRPLPMDIILEIAHLVDVDTYNAAFSRLSRTMRAEWARRPRIGPYSVYGAHATVPPHSDCTSLPEYFAMARDNCRLAAHVLAPDGGDGTLERQPVQLGLFYHGRRPEGECARSSSGSTSDWDSGEDIDTDLVSGPVLAQEQERGPEPIVRSEELGSSEPVFVHLPPDAGVGFHYPGHRGSLWRWAGRQETPLTVLAVKSRYSS